MRTCQSCGEQMSSQNEFCDKCGAPMLRKQPAEVQATGNTTDMGGGNTDLKIAIIIIVIIGTILGLTMILGGGYKSDHNANMLKSAQVNADGIPANRKQGAIVNGIGNGPRVTILYNGIDKASLRPQPSVPTTFSIHKPHLIKYITTTHIALTSAGVSDGTVLLDDGQGRVYGPFSMKQSPRKEGETHYERSAHPHVIIPAGTYRVIVSDPATWATGLNRPGVVLIDGTAEFIVTGGSMNDFKK